MHSIRVFITLWVSSILLVWWVGDFNLYLYGDNGSLELKASATLLERTLASTMVGLIYAGVASLLLRWTVARNLNACPKGE